MLCLKRSCVEEFVLATLLDIILEHFGTSLTVVCHRGR